MILETAARVKPPNRWILSDIRVGGGSGIELCVEIVYGLRLFPGKEKNLLLKHPTLH
jgi:hypothetical protein